jgi:TolA-binding protein
MKTYLLFAILAGTVLAAMSFAQEPFEEDEAPHAEEGWEHAEAMEREIHMRNMELELNERQALTEVSEQMRQLELKKEHMALQQEEAEMDFNQKMREIELQKHRLALKNKQQRRKHPEAAGHCGHGEMFPLLAICCIVNILVAVWVYQDIRRRNSGSGI